MNHSEPKEDALERQIETISTSELKVRLHDVRQAKNPLIEAARPLMRAASDLRTIPVRDNVYSYQAMLVREVKVFQHVCEQAEIRREHVIAARYALCSAIDEFASKIHWSDGDAAWGVSSLLVTFHKEAYGGVKFFQLLGRLAQSPEEHHDILELMAHLMGLGYGGRYNNEANGVSSLETLRQRIYALLHSDNTASLSALSPNWRGLSGKSTQRLDVPLWLTAGLFGLLMVVVFAWFKYQVVTQSNQLETRIEKIGGGQPVMAKPIAPLNLRQLLKNEIARGVVHVSEDGTRTTVVFTGDNMFTSGSADVSATIKPTLDKVASEINKVSGRVVVIGHTDSSPIKSAKFANNQVLSEQRAQSVVGYLQSVGVSADRLSHEGKGDSAPVADNKTPANKAKNRRVEVQVIQ